MRVRKGQKKVCCRYERCACPAWAVAAAGITRMWSVSLCVRKSVRLDGKTEYNYMLTMTRGCGRAAVLDSELGCCN